MSNFAFGIFPACHIVCRFAAVLALEMGDIRRLRIGAEIVIVGGTFGRNGFDIHPYLTATHAVGLGFGGGSFLVHERNGMLEALGRVYTENGARGGNADGSTGRAAFRDTAILSGSVKIMSKIGRMRVGVE